MGNYYLAVDIGASSGRHMLASMEDGKMNWKKFTVFQMEWITKTVLYAGM